MQCTPKNITLDCSVTNFSKENISVFIFPLLFYFNKAYQSCSLVSSWLIFFLLCSIQLLDLLKAKLISRKRRVQKKESHHRQGSSCGPEVPENNLFISIKCNSLNFKEGPTKTDFWIALWPMLSFAWKNLSQQEFRFLGFFKILLILVI